MAKVFNSGLTDRTRVQILTVDPPTRRIEGAIKDGSTIQIAAWDDAGHVFRWPLQGETWIVRRDNGIWRLDRRIQSGHISTTSDPVPVQIDTERHPITTMLPGDMKLDADVVVDASGRTFVAVDLTGIQNGWTIRWNSTLKRFVAGP